MSVVYLVCEVPNGAFDILQNIDSAEWYFTSIQSIVNFDFSLFIPYD